MVLSLARFALGKAHAAFTPAGSMSFPRHCAGHAKSQIPEISPSLAGATGYALWWAPASTGWRMIVRYNQVRK